MKLKKYTENDLRSAIKTSFSFVQTLKLLNVIPCGGNYRVIKRAIAHFNIDNSHFTFQLWNKGQKIGAKVAIEEYLSNNKEYFFKQIKETIDTRKYFSLNMFRLQS